MQPTFAKAGSIEVGGTRRIFLSFQAITTYPLISHQLWITTVSKPQPWFETAIVQLVNVTHIQESLKIQSYQQPVQHRPYWPCHLIQ